MKVVYIGYIKGPRMSNSIETALSKGLVLDRGKSSRGILGQLPG